jgi:uncharacterized protein (DUF924 family)
MTDHASADDILAFWFGRPGDPDWGAFRRWWFDKNDQVDAGIRARFEAAPRVLAGGAWRGMAATAEGCLAATIALDQFPRNMHRGTPAAFACDAVARESARLAVARGWDRDRTPHERLFLYLPFGHSEDPADQDLSLALVLGLAGYPDTKGSIDSARRHREIVHRFGRFPHRNVALGRTSTPDEMAFLKEPNSSF